MSSTSRILWGINRPDGTPVQKSPTWGSAFWAQDSGHHGFTVGHEDAAAEGAKEYADILIRQGVLPEAAKHDVVRVVIETTVKRELV